MRILIAPCAAAPLFGLACLLLATLAQAAPFEGRLLRSQGQVTLTDAEGVAVDLASVDNRVREAQTITTGPDSRAVLRFNNGTITILDANSRLRVRTPNWFVHLAGKAFFAFKRLVGAADERRVQNTAAFIGIRGTTFLSYADEPPAVALEEGELNLQTVGDAYELVTDGAPSQVPEFVLRAQQMVTFDGNVATVTAFTPGVLADFAAFELFGGELIDDFVDDYTPELPVAEGQAAPPPPAEEPVAAAAEESPPEQAQEQAAAGVARGGLGFYLGAGVGLSAADRGAGELEGGLEQRGHSVSDLELDDVSEGGRVFAGYHFTNNFAVEGGYLDLGEFASTIDASTGDADAFARDVADLHPLSAEGAYVAAVGRLNLILFSVFAKAGLFVWEGEVRADLAGATPVDSTFDGTDPMFGAGVDLSLGPLGVRLEAEHFELDDDAIDMVSGSVVIWF